MDAGPELGILCLVLQAQGACAFRAAPARSVHAALLRRLELFYPDLSQALHDAPSGAASSVHPWTVSPLAGPFRVDGTTLWAQAGESYRVRVAALVPQVVEALAVAFDPQQPIGREPLVLDHVPFATLWEETVWERMSTYPSLLTSARPQSRILLEFRSPTGFRRLGGGLSAPSPRLCLEGYLRKWNAFSSITIPEEPLLGYVAEHLDFGPATLHPAETRLGRYTERGVIGRVEWIGDGQSPALLRVVNALVDYAEYCGTGMKTALGMGQTARVALAPRRG